MSEEFMAHFICDNAVNPDVVEKCFNVLTASEVIDWGSDEIPQPIFNDKLMSLGSMHVVLAEAKYKRTAIHGEGAAERFWMSYAYAHGMFIRMKYAFMDIGTHIKYSRSGESFYWGKPTDALMTEDEFTKHVEKENRRDPPPAAELKIWFDHILASNTHFYVLFSEKPYEDDDLQHMPPYFRGDLMEGRNLVEMDSETAQRFFIEQFGDKYDMDSHHDTIMRPIFKITH